MAPHSASLSRLASTDPDFFQFLQENDEQLLLSFAGGDGAASDSVKSEGSEGGVDSDDEDMGTVEQRPRNVTSHKEVCYYWPWLFC